MTRARRTMTPEQEAAWLAEHRALAAGRYELVPPATLTPEGRRAALRRSRARILAPYGPSAGSRHFDELTGHGAAAGGDHDEPTPLT